MRNTKKREVGIGNNLYGIPIDDILTPEQLTDIRKDASDIHIRKRREKKKAARKNPKSSKIKLPEFKITTNALYIVCGVLALIIIFCVFRNPVSMRIAPKSYVADAADETINKLTAETERVIDNLFGFNVLDAKELTASMNGEVKADSSNTMSDISMSGQIGYSKKNKNAVGRIQYLSGGQEFLAANAYINEDEVGISIPPVFAEYWVAPAKTIGKEWNESGLRKVLYADAIGENANLSFSAIFGEKSFLSPDGKKKAEKLTKRLVSDCTAKYSGKTEILLNGKSILSPKFVFTFSNDSIKKYLTEMMKLILEDNNSSYMLSALGRDEQVRLLFEDIILRLSNSINIKNAVLDVAVYKGCVRSVSLDANYNENEKTPRIVANVSFEALKHICDAVKLQINITGSDRDIDYSVSTAGNHVGDSKKITDKTVYSYKTSRYSYSFENNAEIDFKNKTINGSILGTDTYSTKTLTYNGKCSKKGGLKLELENVDCLIVGERNISGKANIDITNDMRVPKINTSNKKLILDYTKAEAENYMSRIEQTDGVKALRETLDKIIK